MGARELVAALTGELERGSELDTVRLRFATVVSSAAGRATVTLSGSNVASVRVLNAATLTAGQTVAVLQSGPVLLVLGTV